MPASFDWDVINQQHVDRWSRPELNYGCVDFVASAEYMVRPPQPPAYVFVIDTSYQAVQSGMVATVAEAILQSLDAIPNEDGRTKVGLITVDAAVGFYKLVGDEPEMLVVGDLSDIYLPRATGDLMVNLADAKALLSGLLTKMRTMFSETHVTHNCLGTALQAARKLLVSRIEKKRDGKPRRRGGETDIFFSKQVVYGRQDHLFPVDPAQRRGRRD